ncbi:MAG: DMT family transporter [candidate division Zixibacteria bacterium]|nr:DMT family transporter [candidate division Zixibacteria bacterium]
MVDSLSLGEIFALATAVVWAFAVIMFKRSGESVHPIALNLFKDVLAFLLLVPTAYLFGEDLLRAAPFQDYLLLVVSGIIGIGIADTFYFKGLNKIPAGLLAIIACMYSPTIISLSIVFLGESLTMLQLVGAFLIVTAVLTGVSRKGLRTVGRRNLFLGMLFGLIAVVANAVGIVMIKPLLDRSPLFWVTEVRLLAGVISLVAILFFFPQRKTIMSSLLAVRSWKYTIAGSFFGAYLAMVLWLGGMKFTQASIAAALNQTSNLFIFIFAALILKERIDLKRTVAIILAVGGAILVSFG